jgi:hypothetical protein
MARGNIDWVGIQASYRSGQLPTLEIARRYGVTEGAIRYRVKREGWQQDLSPEYQAGVKAAILRSPYESAPRARKGRKGPTEERTKDILAAAIDEGKRVVIKHQDLGELLSSNSRSIAEIIKDEIAEVKAAIAEGPSKDLKPKEQFAQEVALTKRLALLAKAHDSLARASVNAVAIERKSRGLDDMPADPNAPSSINIVYYRSDLELNNNAPRSEDLTPAIEIERVP